MSRTPGNWYVDEWGNVRTDGELDSDGDPMWVAEVYESDDARLIAAAPDLLAALQKDHRGCMEGVNPDLAPLCRDQSVHDLIARATGTEVPA